MATIIDRIAYWLWQHSEWWCRSRWLYATVYWRLLPRALRYTNTDDELQVRETDQ